MLPRALGFAGVWLSPATLLGLAPLLLADGTRGLWPPLVLASAACLAAALLAAPWAARPAGVRPTLVDLVRHREASAGPRLLPLSVAASASALLFLWAQLAAGRELARVVGWPAPAAIGLAALVLVLLAGAEDLGRRLAPLGAAVALVGLALPLAAVLLASDAAWPRAFHAVASRPRVVFEAGGPWTREGLPVRGSGPEVALRVTEEQRLVLLGRGRIRVEPWEGGAWSREMTTPTELTLRPGDRLVVPDGFAIRFQAGRAIPGAPPGGPDWLDPGAGPGAWRPLAGLAVTLLVGALGLAPVHGALPAARGGAARAAALGAFLGSAGLAASVLWALYAVWLTPEVYVGGVLGSEVYELPARVSALGAAGPALRDVALLGLAGGGLAAGLAALRGVPRGLEAGAAPAPGRAPGVVPTVAALAGLLATLVPVGPWPLLVAAFGLAASACAPAALAASWSERLGARALAVGAGVGLAAFGALSVAGLAGLGGAPERAWLAWLTAWPAMVAAPLNALAVWLLTPGSRPSARTPVPPGLADLHP